MSLQALLFDVDGTLADTEETHREAFNGAFDELGLPHVWSREEYAQLLGVTGGKERLRHYFTGLALSGAERERLLEAVPDLHRAKTRRYAEIIAGGGSPLRPGIRRLLDEAAAAGVRVGIATTTSEANVVALLEAALGPGAPERFAVIACGDAVPAKKPAPDIYLLALERLALAAGEVVAFEDSENGLAAAKAAGLYTVVTPTHWSAGHDLGAADLALPHLGDPQQPLDAACAARIGGPFLTLAALNRLHASAAATAD